MMFHDQSQHIQRIYDTLWTTVCRQRFIISVFRYVNLLYHNHYFHKPFNCHTGNAN